MLNFMRELNMVLDDEREEDASNFGSWPMATKPVYGSFKFSDNPHRTRRSKEENGTRRQLYGQKGVDGVFRLEDTVCDDAKCSTSPSEPEESKERRKIYIKRTVIDSEMPEMVAFIQDNDFMDEEAHCEDDSFIDNCELDHYSISSMPDFDEESSNESTTETLDNTLNESELIAEDGCKSEATQECCSEKLMEDENDDVNTGLGTHLVKEVPSEEAVSAIEEEDCTCSTSDASLESDIETTISSTEATSAGGADCQQTFETEIKYRSIDNMSKSLISSNRVLIDEHSNGKSTSYAVDPPLSSIEYSGPIPYSGSVSLCSSSSTGSSHSFAFPILSSEWIGSPVRMANAEQKKLQRHQRHWRKHFLCCKF